LESSFVGVGLIVDEVTTQIGCDGIEPFNCECSIGSTVVLATVKDYDTSHNNRDDVYTGH